jgi:nucleotide-binding universal stress UspA family protein
VTSEHSTQRLVVPLDAVDHHPNAVAVATAIARKMGAEVEIVVVVDPASESVDPPPATTMADGVAVTTTFVRSPSVEAPLLDYATRPGTTMCLPSSGHTAVFDTFARSVSAWLVHRSNQAMFVVGPRCTAELRGTVLAIAVDGTPDGEAIIEPALDVAATLGLVPMLYQVLPEGTQAYVRDARESTYVARLAQKFARTGVEIEYDVLHDRHVGRGLSRLAEDGAVAMVAMATHGHTADERLLLPSVAHQLIRHSPCPVLLAPRTVPEAAFDHGSGRRVVVGVDGSSADEVAIAVGVEEAQRREAALEVVHAWVRSWHVVDGDEMVSDDTQVDKQRAQSILDAALAHATDLAPSINTFGWLAERLPINALLEACTNADLLVLGEHRYNSLERWMFGSTTEAALNRAVIPVLVVPDWADVPHS